MKEMPLFPLITELEEQVKTNFGSQLASSVEEIESIFKEKKEDEENKQDSIAENTGGDK